MQERDKPSTGQNARPQKETIDQSAAAAPDDPSRTPEIHKDQVKERSQKKRQDGDGGESAEKPPEDEPGAEGERSARADEDTYD